MSLKRSGALFWFLAALLAIHKISSHASFIKANVAAENVKSNNTLRYRDSTFVARRLSSPWRHDKLSPGHALSRHRSGAQSAWTTTPSTNRTTMKSPPTSTTSTTQSVIDLLSSKSDQNAGRRMDSMDSSSSENHPRSVIWPARLRQVAPKRFRAPTPTTPTPQVLLKLLQPKPTRPAIYSLDGFVPKPSLQNLQKIVATTEPPYLISRNDLQQLPSISKRRKINKFSKDETDDEDTDEDEFLGSRRKKPVSRYTAFARKGIPGQDFPIFGFIPQTEFHCGEQPGFYADPYTSCQVWHMCPGGNFSPRHSFLCPNGTIFNQKKRICDWWYNVDCKKRSRRNIRSLEIEYDNYIYNL